MQRSRLIPLLVPAALAIATVATPAQAENQTISFQCAEGRSFVAHIKPREAVIEFDTGKTMTLLPLDSYAGQKFANLNTLFAVHDGQAYIEERFVKVLTQCVAADQTANISANKR